MAVTIKATEPAIADHRFFIHKEERCISWKIPDGCGVKMFIAQCQYRSQRKEPELERIEPGIDFYNKTAIV